jgi:hypothetical protein
VSKPANVTCERCVFLCQDGITARCLCRCGQLDSSGVLVQAHWWAHWWAHRDFPEGALLTPECRCGGCKEAVKALLPLLSKSEKDIQVSSAGELGSLNWEEALRGD